MLFAFSDPYQSADIGAVIDGPRSMAVGRTLKKKKKALPVAVVKPATRSVNDIANGTRHSICTRGSSACHAEFLFQTAARYQEIVSRRS